MNIRLIAALTLKEASRQRLVLILLLITLFAIGLSGWGFARVAQVSVAGVGMSASQRLLVESELLVLLMFMFSGMLGISAVFLSSLSVSSDLASGVALSVLARPIGRTEWLLGKWLGLCAAVVMYTALTCLLEFSLVYLVVGYSPPRPLMTFAFLSAEGITLVTLGLMLSTRLASMAAAIAGAAAFFLTWMGGVVGGMGIAVHNITLMDVGTISQLLIPADGLWRGAIYGLEPKAILNLVNGAGTVERANPFFVGSPPTPSYLLWCVFWLLALLFISISLLSRREL